MAYFWVSSIFYAIDFLVVLGISNSKYVISELDIKISFNFIQNRKNLALILHIKLLFLRVFKTKIYFFIDGVSTKMHQNNVFTVAKRTLEGQDMVYQAVKFTNNVWALCELKLSPGNNVISVRSIQKFRVDDFPDFLNFWENGKSGN